MTSSEKKSGFFKKLKNGLSKTHQAVVRRLDEATLGKREINDEILDNFEEIMISSDLGINTVIKLMDEIRFKVKRNELKNPEKLKEVLKENILQILQKHDQKLDIKVDNKPFIILTVGVNGTGKTTTIAKLANKFKTEGHSVMLAAADTFRAAAIDQLEIWGDRVGCRVIKHKPGADPSAVAFDAIKSAKANDIDVLIIDTAGRLHTKAPLMDELKKIYKVIKKEHPDAPHETLIVLDATTGQNAVSQSRIFKETVDITGIALTKLDGTAKGGVIVAVSEIVDIPVRYIGIGEQMDDLREFNAEDFVDAMFED
jgi:fused signal recognition particle receptor